MSSETQTADEGIEYVRITCIYQAQVKKGTAAQWKKYFDHYPAEALEIVIACDSLGSAQVVEAVTDIPAIFPAFAEPADWTTQSAPSVP